MLGGIIARTAFEQELVDEIEHCDRSMEQLLETYDKSCMLCTLYGRIADCNACPIEKAAIAKAEWHNIHDKSDILG